MGWISSFSLWPAPWGRSHTRPPLLSLFLHPAHLSWFKRAADAHLLVASSSSKHLPFFRLLFLHHKKITTINQTEPKRNAHLQRSIIRSSPNPSLSEMCTQAALCVCVCVACFALPCVCAIWDLWDSCCHSNTPPSLLREALRYTGGDGPAATNHKTSRD